MSDNNFSIDLTDYPEDYPIILLPTSYSVCAQVSSREFKKHINIRAKYYNGLTSNHISVNKDLNCDLELEKKNLKDSLIDNIKITDTFNICKKDITDDIIKKFRWCEPLIEYPKQELLIYPYILGLWLGDGNSRNIGLTSIDIPIINYWMNYAENNGNKITINNIKERTTEIKNKETIQTCTYSIVAEVRGQANDILKKFQDLKLINNKHIPKIYLENSIENRLKVLAGLLDTDGYLESTKYEITQKSTILSENIITLAKSLGFFANSRIKKAYASNT